MRIAEICPTCATYINASCILYDGDYLSSIAVSPLDPLDEILGNINGAFTALSGSGDPTSVPLWVGQFYIDTSGPLLYVALSTTTSNWALIGTLITTTTTSTTTSTTSTTTTTP